MDELLIDVATAVPSLTRGIAGATRWAAMDHFVYILQCNDGRRYYGSTGDLSRRLAEHREGFTPFTKSRLPVKLVYFEACETLAQARRKERALKNGRTRRKKIDRMIADFPAHLLAPFA